MGDPVHASDQAETTEPEPLMSRQQFRAKLRELHDQAAWLRAEYDKGQERIKHLAIEIRAQDAAGKQLARELQHAERVKVAMHRDFTTAIRTAWPRLTDAEKTPLLDFWKRLGHKEPPGPMSGLVLVGG